MEVFKRETEEVIRRFRRGSLSHRECLTALDAALAGAVAWLTADQLDSVRAVTGAANDAVMQEMERRKFPRAQSPAMGLRTMQ